MAHRFGMFAAALLATAGCDGGGGNASGGSGRTRIQIANPFQDRLIKLSEVNRSLALRRAIQDSGQFCKKITGSAYVGPYKGQHMWAGRCQPGGDWAIFIAPNGNVQVRSCGDAKTLKLPECKLPEAAES